MYVIRHEDESIGPFDSWKAAQTWLDSVSDKYSDQSYTERLEDPVKTKALWAEWDGETEEDKETRE